MRARDPVREWFERMHPALADALATLVACESLPEPVGVVARWVDALCTLRFEAGDVAAVVALIGKRSPYLQEVGVRLAVSIMRDVRSWDALEPALAALIDRGPVDDWVALAIVELLRATYTTTLREPVALFEALVRRHGQSRPGDDGIHRNRAIAPWHELERFYVSCLVCATAPGPRERAVLPVLERRFGTRGLAATQARARTELGLRDS
jgi:hypothetical protein